MTSGQQTLFGPWEPLKRCSRCRKYKRLEDFSFSRTRYRDRKSYCKECDRSLNKQAKQKRKENGKTLSYYLKRRPHLREYQLQKAYGLTQAQYEAMLALQNGVCAICGRSSKHFKASKHGHHWALAVDHDHRTGKVRGILCARCNQALGKFADSPELFEKAATYLRKHQA